MINIRNIYAGSFSRRPVNCVFQQLPFSLFLQLIANQHPLKYVLIETQVSTTTRYRKKK